MMRFLLVICGIFVSGLASAQPNRLFYVCDSLVSTYYGDRQYEAFKSAWEKLPPENIPLQSYQSYLQIALANADTTIEGTLSMLIEKYGFDVAHERQYAVAPTDSTPNIFFHRQYYDKWARLFAKWQQQHADLIDVRRAVAQFQAKERVVYPKYMKSETDSKTIDSLFEDLLSLCERQNALPNVERNGYGQDISIPLWHILSVSDSLLQERWRKILPFILEAFHAGEISNSYFFLYDRLLYEKCGKQFFGGMGDDVPLIDKADLSERKRQYLIDEASALLKINAQWREFYDSEQP